MSAGMRFGQGPSIGPRQKQRQRLTPQQQLGLEVLQLSTLALQERISQELEENPALELQETALGEGEIASETEPDVSAEQEDASDEFEKFADWIDKWQEDNRKTRKSRTSNTIGQESEVPETPARPMSLQEHLCSQVHLMDMSDGKVELIENVIGNLDARGYLMPPLSDIGADLKPARTEEEMLPALHVVQGLEPRGVGARDLEECLLLQLDSEEPSYALKRALICKHLESIEKNRIPEIARELGQSIEATQELISEIGALNPRPGAQYGGEAWPREG